MNVDENPTPSSTDAAATPNDTTTSPTPAVTSSTAPTSAPTPSPSGSPATDTSAAPAPSDPPAAPAPAPVTSSPPPATTATPAPAPAPTATRPTPPAATSTQATLSAQQAANLALAQATLTDVLNSYQKAMAPATPINAEQGAAQQLNIYRMLMNVVSRPGVEFTPLWTQVLSFAHTNVDGVFGARYLYRFFSNLRLPIAEIRNFERLLNLIVLTANPQTRAVGIKQVDMQVVLKNMALPNIVQNLRSYYSV